MLRIGLVLLFSIGLSASLEVRAQYREITQDSVFTLTPSLKLLTPTPHVVSKRIAELCVAAPPPDLLAAEVARAGPHANVRVNLYISAGAATAITRADRRFPVETVIVKEKLSSEGTVTAVGGMIKRARGFDPEHGDWEYFYADKSGGFSKGLLANCVQCHAKANSSDHVYTVKKARHD